MDRNRHSVRILLVCVALWAAALGAATCARADEPSSAARAYAHARASASLAPFTLADIVADPSAHQGAVVEATGRVSGTATGSAMQVLIVEVGSASYDMQVPATFDQNLCPLDIGSMLRMLVKAPVAATGDPGDGLVLEAAATEADVAAMDKPALSRDGESRAILYHPQPSRSAMYSTPIVIGHPIAALSPQALAVYTPYRAAIARFNPRLSSVEVDTITTSILFYSDYYRIDPRLIIAMIIAESSFDPHCTSRTGAMGLGQLMPGTAAGLGVRNAYDPVQNIGGAVALLSGHVRRYGGTTADRLVPLNTLLLSMAAYNAGSGAVKRYGGVPPYRETQNYVRKVAALYRHLCGG